MKIRNRTAVAATLATLLALSACSGDDGRTSTDDPTSAAGTEGDETTTTEASTIPEDATPLEATGLAIETPAGTTEVDSITWAVYRPTAPIDPLFAFD
jgi:hypothetical protein